MPQLSDTNERIILIIVSSIIGNLVYHIFTLLDHFLHFDPELKSILYGYIFLLLSGLASVILPRKTMDCLIAGLGTSILVIIEYNIILAVQDQWFLRVLGSSIGFFLLLIMFGAVIGTAAKVAFFHLRDLRRKQESKDEEKVERN